MKRTKKIMLGAIALCVFLCLAALSACNKRTTPTPDADPKPIDYTITLKCDDVSVLSSAQVQLFLNGTAVTEAKNLDSDHKAVFNLEPASYTVSIGGIEGYTYPNTTVTAAKPNITVTLTKEGGDAPATYGVTYSFGSCEGADYAGSDTLPTEDAKEEGEKFPLAGAPVWEDHAFMGWSDGVNTYAAGAEYTMPASAVILTATWMAYVEDINLPSPGWVEGATEGGQEIVKGQYVRFSTAISSKDSGDDANGVQCKIFPDSKINNNYFYQFRADFVVKRKDWNWREDNYGFSVEDGGWNEDSYKNATEGTTEITVALSYDGVLTYTFKFTSDGYSHNRVFTDTQTMDSAVVIFGVSNCTAENINIKYPASNVTKVTLDYGYDNRIDVRHLPHGSTYTFGYNPSRTGFNFLGWQASGEGDHYKSGDTYALGTGPVTFIADWIPTITILQIEKNGGSGNVYKPTPVYNAETGLFEVGFPTFSDSSFKKTGYAFKCWEVKVNGEVITVEGDTFTVAGGSTVQFIAIWGDPLTLSYALGECEGRPYGGSTKSITAVNRAEGGKVKLSVAPKEWAGYVFHGWNDGEKTYDAGATYVMPDHSVTLTAVWEKLPHYTVTFNPGSCDGVPYNGNENVDTQDPMYEGGVFPLARALKWDGYTFLGWNDGTTTYAALYRYTMPNHDVVFTAVWEKIPTKGVTYLPGAPEGEVLNMPTATEYFNGQVVMSLPIRFGYTFTGWSDGTNIYRNGDTFTMTADNVTLTAQWEAIEDTRLIILSGLWKLDGENIYFPISGMEAAWDAYKAIGSYKTGAYVVSSITDTEIKFTLKLDRPKGSGTNNFSCTYYYNSEEYGKDVIRISYGFNAETLIRTTAKPATTSSTSSDAPHDTTANGTSIPLDIALADEKFKLTFVFED